MNRIQSVDIFRLIAIIAVISIHTSPFRADLPRDDEIFKYLDVIINQVARFAVPFFFVISGYFWGKKIRKTETPIISSNIMSKKIILIFFAWSFIYLLPLQLSSFYEYGVLGPIKVAYWNLINLAQEPVKFLMQGTKVHLWFLVSLLLSIYISAFFLQSKKTIFLFLFATSLYLFGLLAKSYVNTPIGIEINFNTRNGPFFGLLFFVSGFYISAAKIDSKWLQYGSGLFLLGLVLHFSEIYVLWKYYNTTPMQDYVIGTYFMGVGVAIASLSNHKLLQSNILSNLGKMTLGIYAIHFIFVDFFRVVDKSTDSVFWEIGYVLLVLVLSIVSVILLSKNKFTRKIVV